MKTLFSVLYLHNPLGANHPAISLYDIGMVIITMAGVLFALKATNGALAARHARADFAKHGDPAKHSHAMIMAQYRFKTGIIGMLAMAVAVVIFEIIKRFMLAA